MDSGKSANQQAQPLISIVLCTYNGEKYLAKQLDTLIRQTYANIELIAVDDCSTDKTWGILENYAAKEARLKIYQNPANLGLNANFERAILLASGEYVAITDQDDIWEIDRLRILLNKIGHADLIYHDSVFINDTGKPTGKRMSTLHRFVAGPCAKYLLYNNCISGHATLVKRKAFSQILPFPDGIYYDWWMAFVIACGGKITCTKEALVHYRIHKNSVTQNDRAATGHEKTLKILGSYKNTPPDVFRLISSLQNGYARRRDTFSYQLFALLLRHCPTLFYVRKRSFFSCLKFIIRECIAR